MWFHSQSFHNHISSSMFLSLCLSLSFSHSLCHPNDPHTTHPLLLVGVWCASAKPLDIQPSALFDNLTPCLPRLQFPSSTGFLPGPSGSWQAEWLTYCLVYKHTALPQSLIQQEMILTHVSLLRGTIMWWVWFNSTCGSWLEFRDKLTFELMQSQNNN